MSVSETCPARVCPWDESPEEHAMKTPLTASILAVAALSAATAHAQAPAAPDYAQGAAPQGAPPDPVMYAQRNLQSLRTRLALAPAQANAWNGFVDAVLHQSRDMQAQMAQMSQAPTSAPDRMDRMAQMMRRNADGMAGVARALRQLYSQLDPNQRSILDQEFSRGPGGAPPQG